MVELLPMKLKHFLKFKKMSIQQLADLLERPHETVRHWVHGTRLPRLENAQEIMVATKGKVTISDIYQKDT